MQYRKYQVNLNDVEFFFLKFYKAFYRTVLRYRNRIQVFVILKPSIICNLFFFACVMIPVAISGNSDWNYVEFFFIDIFKNRNKSSVTNKKQTSAEYFIDKKAINKNL